MTTQHASYGAVQGPPTGEITRRSFMRRVLGVGIGLLSLEFLGGTLAFMWPNLTSGLGSDITLGTAEDITTAFPEWAEGLPYVYNEANLFFVNVPAAKARVEGDGTVASPVPDPGTNVDDKTAPVDRSVLALWRKCPHLGCQIPQLCDQSQWFECLCHGSKYTVLGEKRDGPAPRGMDRFSVSVQDGAYVVVTREVISGPPVGTVTFDDRAPTDMAHCTG
ncbi:MAG TPA: Rieske 2Fe-2S domain-containing protein [Candidatus Limnocylindria bacterium]|jgi:cytochrome b6-f complex iron-sulfur subunit|nr:Rieske 2Fe-2S domain-containing protein [Candidatus Limnocylindria bacterium]